VIGASASLKPPGGGQHHPAFIFSKDMQNVSLQGKLTSGNSKKDGFPFNLSSSLQQTVSVVSIRELSLATKW
jgi:hypothetical protein